MFFIKEEIMFNGDLKERALSRLKETNEEYQKVANEVAGKAERLHNLRTYAAREVIQGSEDYVNTLANSPKEFEKSVSELKISFERFESILRSIEDSDNVAKVSGSTAGAGVAAGVGVAAFGPSAAIAIATTFGTASTGTAISALSGAAATNAALAWLGGGAVVAGGGGMAAGNVLLALAGPVGWAIGGTAVLGGALWARKKNKEIAEKAEGEANRIKTSTAKLKAASKEISELHKLTDDHLEGAKKQLTFLKSKAPRDYRQFSDEQKQELGALINNIQSLAKVLHRSVG